jgi:hypothetical protein
MNPTMNPTKRRSADSPSSPTSPSLREDAKRHRAADHSPSAPSRPLHEDAERGSGGAHSEPSPQSPEDAERGDGTRQTALEQGAEAGGDAGLDGWYDMGPDGSDGWFFHSCTQLYFNRTDGKYYRLVDSEYVPAEWEAGCAPRSEQNAVGLTLDVAAYSMKGNKSVQEDRYVIRDAVPRLHGGCVFGVFDGHGGSTCAQFCADNFIDALLRVDSPNQPCEWLVQAFDQVESEWAAFARRRANRSGSTALVVAIDKAAHMLWCANVGDCRAVLCSEGRAMRLTNDHKPNEPAEKATIEAAGGFVLQLQVNDQ